MTTGDATPSGAVVRAEQAPATKASTVSPIEKAAVAINSFLTSDDNFPDLDSYCRRKLCCLYWIVDRIC